jgi:hypothetical protein
MRLATLLFAGPFLACMAAASANARADDAGSPATAQPVQPVPRGPWRWKPGDVLPPGTHVETRPHRALVITGGALLGGLGLISIAFAASSPHDFGYTAIPLAGPFITATNLATARCSLFCDLQAAGAAVFAFLGLAELAGAGMLIAGLATKQQVLRSDVALRVVPVPLVMRNGSGLGLAGTF